MPRSLSRYSCTAILAFTLAPAGCSHEPEPGGSGDARTFEIPVAPYFGSDVVTCGASYAGAGTTGASFELKDFLVFLHGVELVREGGERVPLELVDDQQWQGQGVVLLDFNDATGACLGDAETNARIVGTAPDHGDYVGIAFRVGLPPAQNHLDAVTAPAPLNKPSTWWSWQGGYKFLQLTLATAVHESYFVHVGATACEGSVEDGFSCAGDHEILVDVDDFVPGRDGLRINVAALLAEVDLDAPVDFASGDFIAGCMSFDPDPECDPIFTKLGRRFMSEEAAPEQIAFEVDVDAAPDLVSPSESDQVPQPGSDAFDRDPRLDVSVVSEAGVARSHPMGDALPIGSRTHRRGPGNQCMSCHQPKGPGAGLFDVAGTVWEADGETPLTDATVKLLPIAAGPCQEGDERAQCQDQPVGTYREEDVVATLVTDPYGNFYSTELPPEAAPPFWPVVERGSDEVIRTFMGHPAASGSCNMCHGVNRVRLEAP
ncbi:MbnP family copper-binding protein [Paraliomyxa miuraensis]|uniref:MbnP family copper-binding protein n=1 Tax=Paraliomyxa miuraensis TaxID=376150 RepID=UPI002253DC9B|nr:MbnP family copper-binding protein [Paraliomyxa miuraensis]MCX4241471.1 metallo-mystery pair system four-Cys motif protein [Paraliomyxa miuraensis]